MKTKVELLTSLRELEGRLRRGHIDFGVAADELTGLIDEYSALGLGRSRRNVVSGNVRATSVTQIHDTEPEDPYALGRALVARLRVEPLASTEAAQLLSAAIDDLATLTATPTSSNEVSGNVSTAAVVQIGSMRPADGASISRFLRDD